MIAGDGALRRRLQDPAYRSALRTNPHTCRRSGGCFADTYGASCMNLPSELKYTATHEWVRLESGVVLVGITDPAQEMLGDLVFVGDVKVGARLQAGDTAGVVESVKAASDIHTPVAGVITEWNEDLSANPELINSAPYDTWIFKLQPDDTASLDSLLDADAYRDVADARSEERRVGKGRRSWWE